MKRTPFAPQETLLQEKARVLVTGAGGFIGSALVHELNRRGLSRIVVTDFLGEDEKWKNLLPLEFEDYVAADKFLEMVKRDPDHYGKFTAVFHLGACSSTTVTDAEYVLKNNYACTKSLCKWSLAQGARFVYASSAATYGDGSAGMDDRADDLRAFRPLNLYGYSKQLFDLYAAREGLLPRIVGIKYFNVFGPNEYHKGDMRSLVCKAFEQIRSTGRIRLFKSYRPEYPDGGQQRDFVYVKDAVDMRMSAGFSTSARGWPARGWTSRTPFSRLSGNLRTSSSSTCRKTSRASISIIPARISPNFATPATPGRPPRSRTLSTITP